MRNILFFDCRSIEMAFYFLCIFLELDKLGTTILHLLKIVRRIHCGIVVKIFLKMQNLDDSPDRSDCDLSGYRRFLRRVPAREFNFIIQHTGIK